MSKIVRVKNLDIGAGRPKVCGLVMGSDEDEILNMVELANSSSCDMFEFRADYFADILDIPKTKK
ncbi:MAG: 3-dehydroquinate dehydratase, partial [Parasporobacterium sp.]|nr:3-dehydroquinate dehydratase [Parasporobacterium sp.]